MAENLCEFAFKALIYLVPNLGSLVAFYSKVVKKKSDTEFDFLETLNSILEIFTI